MEKNQKPFSLKQKIFLCLFGILLFFLLLEGALQLSAFTINSIREHQNFQSALKQDVYRILCLGESTTAGQYPRPLEEMLNKKKLGINFSVIDAGKGNATTSEILASLEGNLTKYKPDMVVVMMGINDEADYMPLLSGKKSRSFGGQLRTVRLAKLIWLHLLRKYNPDFQSPKKLAAVYSEMESFDYKDYLRSGDKYLNNNMFEQAQEAFKKALVLNPQSEKAYIGLGRFYQTQGKFAQAEEAFKEGLKLDPGNSSAVFGLAGLYQDQGKLLLSQEVLEQAAQKDPKDSTLCLGLALNYKAQGRLADSEAAFKKVLSLDPRNEHACIELGWLYQQQGKAEKAQEAFRKVMEINPENDVAPYCLGWIYQLQGKFAEAELELKKAIDINPRNGLAYRTLIQLYQEEGLSRLAKEYSRQAEERQVLWHYNPVTVENYHKLKEALDQRKIKLVCVQYPNRSLRPLKEIFSQDSGVVFVDNQALFAQALKKADYRQFFTDMFGGDFGHCTEKGNRLLAANIAGVIAKDVFGKPANN